MTNLDFIKNKVWDNEMIIVSDRDVQAIIDALYDLYREKRDCWKTMNLLQ